MGPLVRALGVILIVTLHRRCYAITKNFVNSSMPEMRPTFVVNFDMATVICQHSADPSDLHLHQMSILCDGKSDCYRNPAMHDESFPYCEGRCNSTCSGRGACLFDGSRGQCYCNAGFHGPECELVDNNECEDKPCHWLAHCQNTLGSYYCTCFPGFHGNGHECSDIDECSSGIAHCPEYSNCVNLPGTYFCNCSEGFQPLGLPLERCADIDECEQGLHDCAEPLMCQNEVGGYRCVNECSEGYRLVNGSCVDIDECSEKLAECDKRASCTNTVGGYKCTCEEGFAGNGRTCSPLNDCSQQEGICDRHAFCLGSLRMCICQAGYVGDGLSCYDVNECNARVNPCEGQPGNRCVNIDGGYICCEDGTDDDVCIREKGAFCSGGCGVHAVCYNETCQCMEGFEGDPRVKCDDINECENDKQCAGVGEWCVNMIGGYTCCGPDSKEEECKSKCVTTLANGNETTSELDHEVKGGTRSESMESVGHKSSGGLIVTNGKIISNEYVEIACDIGCPPNSHCKNGTCRCDAGYNGNTKEGCHDIDECERSPCTEVDSWCVNLPGSFQCCTTQSNMSDCIGLEIVAGAGMRLGDSESTEANIAESSLPSASVGTQGGKWKVETFGEWRNFSGGAVVIGRGKIENGMWNITGGEDEEGLSAITNGKKEAERLISLISGFGKGSGTEAIELPDATKADTTDFAVIDNGLMKAVGSGKGEAGLSGSGTSIIDKNGDALKQDGQERSNFTSDGYGMGTARVAVAIGGAQKRPILSMNGTITGNGTGNVRTWEKSLEEGVSSRKDTGERELIADGDGAGDEGGHVMMAVGGAPGAPILEMNGAISAGDRKGINEGKNSGGNDKKILKITGDSHRKVSGEVVEQSLRGGDARGVQENGNNVGGASNKKEKGSGAKSLIVTTDGDTNVEEREERVHAALGGSNKEPLFKINATAINGAAKGTPDELISKETKQIGNVVAGSGKELSRQGTTDESDKGSNIVESSSGGSSIRRSEVNVGGELGNNNANGAFSRSGQSSESSHGEIITQNGGSLLIKNVGQPEPELTVSQLISAVTDSGAAERTAAGKDEGHSTTLPIELTASGVTVFTTLVTQSPEIPGEEKSSAAVHKEIDEATVVPKIAIVTSNGTKLTESATAGRTIESLPTKSENISPETTKAPFIPETTSEKTEVSQKTTAESQTEIELTQRTTLTPVEEIRSTSEENAKEEEVSFGEGQSTSTPASSQRSTERESNKKDMQIEGGLGKEQNLMQQRTSSTTREPEAESATSLSPLESTITTAVNEQGEKTKYTEGFPMAVEELISQTTAHQTTNSGEENMTSNPSHETAEMEEHSASTPDSGQKPMSTGQARISTETETTKTFEIETFTKRAEIEETMAATKSSEGNRADATTEGERGSKEESETTLATSTSFETTVPEGEEEEELSETSMERQGQTSLKPLDRTSEELPPEGSESETTPSAPKEMSSTVEVTALAEETTTERDKQATEAFTSGSESTATSEGFIVKITTPDASESHLASSGKADGLSPSTETVTKIESSSTTPPKEDDGSPGTRGMTTISTEIESSSTVGSMQETKTLEHETESTSSTTPVLTEAGSSSTVGSMQETKTLEHETESTSSTTLVLNETGSSSTVGSMQETKTLEHETESTSSTTPVLTEAGSSSTVGSMQETKTLEHETESTSSTTPVLNETGSSSTVGSMQETKTLEHETEGVPSTTPVLTEAGSSSTVGSMQETKTLENETESTSSTTPVLNETGSSSTVGSMQETKTPEHETEGISSTTPLLTETGSSSTVGSMQETKTLKHETEGVPSTTPVLTEAGSSSTVGSMQETKTLEHETESTSSTTPVLNETGSSSTVGSMQETKTLEHETEGVPSTTPVLTEAGSSSTVGSMQETKTLEHETESTSSTTPVLNETGSSSKVGSMQETKEIEDETKGISTTKPVSENGLTIEKYENASTLKQNEETMSTKGSSTKGVFPTTTEDHEQLTTLKPKEVEGTTEDEGQESTQSSTRQISTLKSSTIQEAVNERTAEAMQPTTGAGSVASVEPDAEGQSTTYHPQKTTESFMKGYEVTEPNPIEELRSTEQPAHETAVAGSEKETTLSELNATVSAEKEGNFDNEINTTTSISETIRPDSSSPKSDSKYGRTAAGEGASESPNEKITGKPINGKQEKEGHETSTTVKKYSSELDEERNEESTTPVSAKPTTINTPVKEAVKEGTIAQSQNRHETGQMTSESTSVSTSKRPLTTLSLEMSSTSPSITTQSAEREKATVALPSSSNAEESQSSVFGDEVTSLEPSSTKNTPAVNSEDSVTVGKAETSVPSDENNLSVEKYSSEMTSKPKIIGAGRHESTPESDFESTASSEDTATPLPTEAHITSPSETTTTPELGLEIIRVTASSIPESVSTSSSHERETTTEGLSFSGSTLELAVLRTDHPTKAHTGLLGSSTPSAAVTFQSSSEPSGWGESAKIEAEDGTTIGAKNTDGETEGEGKTTPSTPSSSFGSTDLSSSREYLVTHIPERKGTAERDGDLAHITSSTTETTSTATDEEGSGELEEIVGNTHTADISTTMSNEEQSAEGYGSTSISETTEEPESHSTSRAVILASRGSTIGPTPKTAAEKLDSLRTPDIEQDLHTSVKEPLETSTTTSTSITEEAIRGSAGEQHTGEKSTFSTTKTSIELSTPETAHFTVDSNETEETVEKEDSASRTSLLPLATPSYEETTFKTGPSTSPSSSVRDNSSTVGETTEMIETNGTYAGSTIIESSSGSFAESTKTSTTTVIPKEETLGKDSEAGATLSAAAEATTEGKEPFTSSTTKAGSAETFVSTSPSSNTETSGPTSTSITTEVEEEMLKKGVSESSTVIPLDQQTRNTSERDLQIPHATSMSIKQPESTLQPELQASGSARKEGDGNAGKEDRGTTEHGVQGIHLSTTKTPSETGAMGPTNESGKFTVFATPETATSPPVDQLTIASGEKTKLSSSASTIENKLTTKSDGGRTTVRSELNTVTPSIPIDSSEVAANVPKEEGILNSSTIVSSSTPSSINEKHTSEVTFGYGATTESTSDMTHSTDEEKADNTFQPQMPQSTALKETVSSPSTITAAGTTTEGSTNSPTPAEMTERVISTTLSSVKETEVTTLRSTSTSEYEVPSARETTATTDAGVIRTTLEETARPKTANLPERWRTTKETFSLKTTTDESPSNASLKTTRCRSNDHCGLDAYCERRSGACRCSAGFDGAPPHTPCVDVNECERHLDDCHSTARCSNFIGGYTCLCETGYRKNNDGVCVDIDECNEHAGSSCHPKAICTNLPGSYSCQCITGYAGDGYTCLPLDKRHCTIEEWEKMDCGRNHLCLVDGHGNGDCDTCKSGFIMRDGSCSDIDECADAETNVCHADAICKNLVGSFACQCQPGFKGDGFQCVDVDECQQNPCHPHATCINFPGSYTCKCPDGWNGDGTNECINPLDEKCRNKEAICKRTNHTSCLSVRLGELVSVCECDANYRYNNESGQCEDINECEENRHSCDPSTSVCVNTDGGYMCECAAGYEGTGGICVDVDECERGLAGCNVAAYCENYIGSVGCKCAPGYTGDGIDCTPIDVLTSSSNACTQEWIQRCLVENKTCHIDDEDVPQCGSCLVGHQPVGGQCLPINGIGNCADPNKNDCDPNADCTDVHPGRHFCTCKVGYIGDGRRCDDVDECSLPGVCDAAADCHNTNGSFACICQAGYSGNGFKCVRSTNANGGPNCHLDPSMCHQKANCLLAGTCECINGYVGDGITSCEPESKIQSTSKEQNHSITSQPSDVEKTTSMTLDETQSTATSAMEGRQAMAGETSTTMLTTTSIRDAPEVGEEETASTTGESAEKMFVSTTKLASAGYKKPETTTEQTMLPSSPKSETVEAETVEYTVSSSEASIETTTGEGEIALPTEGTDQSENSYEAPRTGIISSGPPGTSPTSEKDLEGINGSKKLETPFSSIGSSTPHSSYITSQTTKMPEKLITFEGMKNASMTKDTKSLEEELRGGSEQMLPEKTAEDKETKLTKDAERTGKLSSGYEHIGGIDMEVTGGKPAGEGASGEVHNETSGASGKLTHGTLSGSKAMMGIGVKRTGEVASSGVTTEGVVGSDNLGGITEKQSHRNRTGEATGKGERTVIKIAIGGPEGTSRERGAGSIMSTKMDGRLDSGKGMAKMTGEVHSGATADRSQIGINVAKTISEIGKEAAQSKPGNGSTSISERSEIAKEEGSETGAPAEERETTQHVGEEQTTKESSEREERTGGAKPVEEQTKRPDYRTHFIQKCTSSDTSPCHENAKCDISSGHCVCNVGYYGDGYSACTKITQDCILDASACDTRAVCDVASRRCRCLKGYVGDGLTCFPDVLDCVLRPNLCSDFASCIGRRCVCNEGYTGDGSSCVSLQPVTDCSKCDVRAECVDNICKCRKSYFGNGGTCIADPADCVHYPGLCHRNALCNDETRRCQCLEGFIGDGLDCSHQKSCLNDSTVCHEDADCLPSGVCQCRRGFTGNGIFCHAAILINAEETTSAPRFASIGCEGGCRENEGCFSGRCQCLNGYERNYSGRCVDIDECSLPNDCHPLAVCVNLPGSHTCTCPDGYRGDGRTCTQYHHINNMAVDCGMDGMTLVFTNGSELFDGRIFVRGQTENPYCSKKLSSIAHDGSDYRFTVPFAHCNVRFEEPDTFAVTIVVQRHPMFITQTADAYDLRCTYPVGSLQVMSHVNVSEMTTADTIVQTGSGPICSLTVTNDDDEVIDTATVGQVLRLALSVQPNDTYAILPRNCFAINLETGERYSLTDQAGCAIDTQLFPEWIHKHASVTTATFRTFKWPDSSMIRFQCDCSACIGSCPKVNCDRRREAIKRRRLRLRYARGINDEAIDEADNELEKSLVSSAHAMAFSHAVHVDDDEEERRAQREVDNWKYQGFTSLEPLEKDILVERICVRAMWIGVSVLPLLLIFALLGALSLLWKRKSRSIKGDHCQRTIYASKNADNASSYLKF